jgi:hypothetical protein
MNRIVPILPCKSLDELLNFYKQLGFEVVYHQKSPNPYAVVEKDWIRLDFYGIKHHDPKKCYHTCYILADEADALYEQFSNALRKQSGKLPTRGLPRISEIRDKSSGVREFMFSDVAGNCIRIGRKIDSTEAPEYPAEIMAANKRLSLVLDFAYRSEDEPDEYEKVAALLDKAIEREKGFPCINLYKAMTLRADIAIQQENVMLAQQLLNEVKTSRLITDNKEKYKAELQRVADLEQKILK